MAGSRPAPADRLLFGDEIFDCASFDVFGMDTEVNAQATLFGQKGDRRDDGKAVGF